MFHELFRIQMLLEIILVNRFILIIYIFIFQISSNKQKKQKKTDGQ
jgi:uncharacterized membrane protein